MTDIKSMTIDELKELMTQIGEKPFRAKQIYSWLHEHLVTSYDEMANLPKSLKQKLADYPITALETLDVQIGDKAHLVIMYHLFNTLLDFVC